MEYIEHILAYARAGLPVFPCKKDKSPYTPRGFKDATRNEKQIIAWWRAWPDALIGVPTGHLSGIDVLDIDAKKGKSGFDFVPNWNELTPVMARTVNDGVHLYFKHSGVKCTSDQVALGVDTRGDGGYVIIPPSQGYTWVNGHDFTSIPPFPEAYRPPAEERKPSSGGGDVPPHVLASFLADNPNDDLGWDDWNARGMAIWKETAGSDAGRAMFHAWSAKSRKYDRSTTDERWDHFHKSRPDGSIGAGTIIYHAGRFRANDGPGETPSIIGLRKRMDDEPTYFVSLMGLDGELECIWDQLSDTHKFDKLIGKRWNWIYPRKMKPSHWREAVRQALTIMVEEQPSVATTLNEVVWGQLKIFIDNRRTLEIGRVLVQGVWEDEEAGRCYFQLEDFMNTLKRDMTDKVQRTVVAQWIKDWGGDQCSLTVKGQDVPVYWVPSRSVQRQWPVDPPPVPGVKI